METEFNKADALEALEDMANRLKDLDGMYWWDLEVKIIREQLQKIDN